MYSKTTQQNSSRGIIFRNLLFIVLTIVVAYIVTVSIGIDNLRELAVEAGMWGALAVILLKITTIVFAPIGGTPIYVIAGATFGFWNGFLLTLLGDTIGFTIAFYLSRFFGLSIVQYFVPSSDTGVFDRVITKSSTIGALLKARLALLALPELFAYGAGLTRASFFVCFLLIMVPHLVTAILLVFFGDAILQLTENTTYFLVAIVLTTLVALIGGGWFYRDIIRET